MDSNRDLGLGARGGLSAIAVEVEAASDVAGGGGHEAGEGNSGFRAVQSSRGRRQKEDGLGRRR